jgi:formamidopyrimidine-DNA glycosylase
MPELAEIRIMSDFIEENSKSRRYNKIYDVQKGNIFKDITSTTGLSGDFVLLSESNGKELTLNLNDRLGKKSEISVFMGMSGNWRWVSTKDVNTVNFIRLRLDTTDGNSLLCWGSYMGPKYKIGKFGGVKRGPDPTKQFDSFKNNITSNLDKKVFDKPICEVLLEQPYFNGIGNYLRSTILYYMDINPFESARSIIKSKGDKLFEMCRDVPMKAYVLNGGQLRDWKNPNNVDSVEFSKWVFYQKGLSCKDKGGRTFWFDDKWRNSCPYDINKTKTKKPSK